MNEVNNNASGNTAPGAAARRLIRSRGHAALGTSLDGRPYVSLVAVACDSVASPLLLLSDLAQHSRNLADPRVSLLFEDTGLFEDTAGLPDPLAGPRLSLLGRVERHDEPGALARFVARHPSSEVYAGFADFHLYRVIVERGHLVAGFGRISWIEAGDLRGPDAPELAAAEAEIVTHMNAGHADTVALYATVLLGRAGAGWRLTGLDPEGIDLRAGRETARLDFPKPVLTIEAARGMLIALAEQARSPAYAATPAV